MNKVKNTMGVKMASLFLVPKMSLFFSKVQRIGKTKYEINKFKHNMPF